MDDGTMDVDWEWASGYQHTSTLDDGEMSMTSDQQAKLFQQLRTEKGVSTFKGKKEEVPIAAFYGPPGSSASTASGQMQAAAAASLAEKQKKTEVEEKERFLNLSDREKRALAAERRLLGSESVAGVSSLQRQRCFSCGLDITGKTPFQYSENKFCSVGCVKKHRQQNN